VKKSVKISLIAVGSLVVILFIAKVSGLFGKEFALEVAIEKVQKRNITEMITANGKIKPETEVKISSDVSGEIVELYVKEGDAVKSGDILLKIRPDIYKSNLDRMNAILNGSRADLANAQARLKQVQAKFVQAEAEYNRNKKLFDSKTISQSEFEISSANYQSSKAEVDASQQTVQSALFMVQSSEASLKEADDNLKKTTIYAPVSGTISMLNVEKGERVVGTIQMTGTELLRIADLNKMEALVDVNENDILRIHLGDTAMIEVDAYPDRKFKGIVTEVANSSKNSNSAVSVDQVTDFEVRIKILPSSYQDLMTQNSVNYYPFRPGMSTTVDIQTRTVKGVLSVPVQSVTTRTDSSLAALNYKRKSEQKDEKNIKNIQDDSPHIVVFVIDKDDKALMIDVKTGIQDNDYIEILTGLVGNENVVSAPYSAISKKLNNGTKVKKTDKENLYKTN